MKVIVLKEFCGIKKDKELDLPSHLAGPLIEQGIASEAEGEPIEVAPEVEPIEPEPVEVVKPEDEKEADKKVKK